jgi:acyl dehydratase
MRKILYFEDVEPGDQLPAIIKHPTVEQLVMWAGASGDYNPVHFNKDIALSQGLPDVIVQGRLKSSFLCHLLTDWIGERGFLKKLACQHRGLDVPGNDLLCKGRVVSKYTKDGEHYVECEVWIENSQGQKTVRGSAVVILPSRKSDDLCPMPKRDCQ